MRISDWSSDVCSSDLLARWQKADTKNGAGFLPSAGTLLPTPNGQISPSLYTGEPNTNDYVKTVASIGYDFLHDFGGGTVFRQNVRLEDSKEYSTVIVVHWSYLGDGSKRYRYLRSIREAEIGRKHV